MPVDYDALEQQARKETIDYDAIEKQAKIVPIEDKPKWAQAMDEPGKFANEPLFTKEMGLNAIPALATIIGGKFNPVAGAALGGLSQYAITGSSKAAVETGLLGLIPTGVPSSVKKTLVGGILRKAFPIEQLPEDVAALGQYSEQLKPTVGQSTGSNLAQFLENVSGKGAKKAREIEQQTKLIPDLLEQTRFKVTGIKTPTGAELFKEKALPLRNIEDVAFDKIRDNAKNNTQLFRMPVGEKPSGILGPDGKPIMVPEFVEKSLGGPINTQSATGFAYKLKPGIDQLYKELPDSMREKLFLLKQTVDKLTNGSEVITQEGQHFNSFETIKDLRSKIGALAEDQALKKIYQTRETGGLSKLASLLGDDIQDSITTWKVNPQQSLQDLKTANLATPARLKANAFDRLMYESTDVANRKLNPDTFINKMTDEREWYRNKFTSEDRKNIVEVMRSIRAVQPAGQVGNNLYSRSMWVHAGMFGLGALTGSIRQAAGEGMALLVSAHTFADKILLNPKYARLAAKLPSLPTDSFEASNITKTFLNLMKGSAVYMITPDGGKIEAHIDDKGKPIPDFQQ